MKINFYDRLFHIIYSFYRSKFGKKELPVLTSVIVLAATTFLQCFSIALIVSIFIGKKIDFLLLSELKVIYCIVLFIAIIHWLYFFPIQAVL